VRLKKEFEKLNRNGVQEVMIDGSEEAAERSFESESDVYLPNLPAIEHEDVGKKAFDHESDEDVGAESVFDVEGKDDEPPDVKSMDLRAF